MYHKLSGSLAWQDAGTLRTLLFKISWGGCNSTEALCVSWALEKIRDPTVSYFRS